ncbi:hypothetical protein Tco_1141626 [Tanacetum coccineum]
MAALVILISCDTSEDSVGSSTPRAVLFGTILTIILADVSTLVPATIPSVIHDSAAEISIILHKAPKVGVTVVASPAGVLDLIIYSSTDSDSLEDPPAPEHAPSIWRFLLADPIVPRTMTAKKRVHPVPARISANRRRSHSSSSSPPRKRHRTSSCSLTSEGSSPDSSTSLSERASYSVITHSSSPSAGPSRKRCRSLATLVPLATPTPGALSHVRSEEEDIDSDVIYDIEADIAAEAETVVKFKVETNVGFEGDNEVEEEAESSARGIVEVRIDRVIEPEIPDDTPVLVTIEGSREDLKIGLDVVIKELYDHMEEIPTWRIADIEKEQMAREIRALADEREMTRLRERVSMLGGSNMRLRGDLAEERERADSIGRRLSYVQDELRQIHLSHYYDMMDFRRLKTFVMRRLGYSP